MKARIGIFVILLMMVGSALAIDNLYGLSLNVLDSDTLTVVDGDIDVSICSDINCNTIVWENSFPNNLTNGKADITLGYNKDLSLNYSDTYYINVSVNGQQITDFANGDNQILQTIGNITAGKYINPDPEFSGNALFNGNINATEDICITGGNCLSSVSSFNATLLWNDVYLNSTERINDNTTLTSMIAETNSSLIKNFWEKSYNFITSSVLNLTYARLDSINTFKSNQIIEGDANITGGLNISAYSSCDLKTDADGNTYCGTDNTGGASSDLTNYLTNNESGTIDGNVNVTGNITAASHRIECPTGFTSVESKGRQLGCMQTAEEGDAAWYTAMDDCFDTYGGRLPYSSEFYLACSKYSLTGETGNWEWVSDLADIDSRGTVGSTSIYDSTYIGVASSVAYRCWISSGS